MKRWFAPALLAVMLSALIAGPATAAWVPSYYFFDRIAWSPDSKALAVIGRYVNDLSGETFEDTLLVNVESGSVECLSPSVVNFVLSRDGKGMLFRGRWGFYHHDFGTGLTRTVSYQNAFRPFDIVEYSFDRDGTSAVCLRCSTEDPDADGVYSYPLDGGEPVRLASDTYCSPALMNFWQKRRRGFDPEPDRLPVPDRPVVVPGFPGTVWQIRRGLTPGVAVWDNASAGSDTLCMDCRTSLVSWPKPGGQALVGTGPESPHDLSTPGELWHLKPSEEPVSLAHGQFDEVGWRNETHAVVLARPGVPWDVDLTAGTAGPIQLSTSPAWLRLKNVPPPAIWTIRVPRAVFDDPDSARSASISLRTLDIPGYTLDNLPGGGQEFSVGVFQDSSSAFAALQRLRKETLPFSTSGAAVYQRSVSGMLGNFDFGNLKSPDGRRTAFLRSHPHMFQPYTATEVWVDPGGGQRRRLLIEAMATW